MVSKYEIPHCVEVTSIFSFLETTTTNRCIASDYSKIKFI